MHYYVHNSKRHPCPRALQKPRRTPSCEQATSGVLHAGRDLADVLDCYGDLVTCTRTTQCSTEPGPMVHYVTVLHPQLRAARQANALRGAPAYATPFSESTSTAYVRITVPGSSVVSCDRNETIFGTWKIMSLQPQHAPLIPRNRMSGCAPGVAVLHLQVVELRRDAQVAVTRIQSKVRSKRFNTWDRIPSWLAASEAPAGKTCQIPCPGSIAILCQA
jgi:hypothetical protein